VEERLASDLAANPDMLIQVYVARIRALMNASKVEQASELRGKLAAITTNNSPLLNNMAWHLVADADPANLDGATAVELAKKAVELKPQSGAAMNTLGVARYRVGEFKQAVADLEKSTQLNKGRDSTDFFFLAMAHWQLGEAEQARKWYAQGVAWMDKKQRTDEGLLRFRAEAEELLKIAGGKPTTKPQSK
jgi:tetratricopeptide (TPR) repeat protein